ncbi:hypothetical protein I6U48_28425 [Clostridium sp. PL3]|uniref:Gluconate permease n=1 Tax=Clostridium thailandense TaxID=2794346 RepID=A0A949U1T0_9CLOT|nr:gluconate:H+ symporter [Clostridium thailandense]MBV7276803.1 hypothetical protein [Clostridium thailandense]
MPIVILVLGIVFLFITISIFKLNGFLALLLAALLVGLGEGLPILKVVTSIEAGVGGTLSHLSIILGLGAMLGKLMADSGAAQQISMTLINKFGKKNVGWAMALTGFIVCITLYWEVGFIILIPIVFTVATAAEVPLLKVGIPMLASISVAHCFLPPHPGPVAIANIFKANIGTTLMYGLIIAIPAVLIAGPPFYHFFKKWDVKPSKGVVEVEIFKEEDLPSFAVSIFTALVPVLIILVSTIAVNIIPAASVASTFFKFIGNTDIALLIAVFIALYTFGFKHGKKMNELMGSCQESVKGIAMILLIIGGGGAFKQVIVDSGVGQYIAQLATSMPVSPYILAWLITGLIRVAIGSSTVTIFMAAGIITPLVAHLNVNPELMVLAVGAGSILADPPTDPAFWMVKEYFGLSMGQTVKMWTGMTSLIAVIGLIGVMALSLVIH